MSQCETFNLEHQNSSNRCAGFVFAPERVRDADDCYLKSSLSSAVPATLSLIGATLPATIVQTSSLPSVNTISKYPLYLCPANAAMFQLTGDFAQDRQVSCNFQLP